MAGTHSNQERGVAGESLTAAQYRFVYSDESDNSDIKLQTSDTNTETVGVLQNKPADGAAAVYIAEGYSLGTAGGALSPNDEVMSDSSGKAVKATSGKAVLGKFVPKVTGGAWDSDASDGDIIRLKIYSQKDRLLA